MKQKKQWKIGIGLLSIILSLVITSDFKAADSYEDPKTFFYTCDDDTYHIEFTNGENIYYATRAKTASSTSYKRYATLGWQIRLQGGNSTVSVDLKNDGQYLKLVDEDYNSDGYCYMLYRINYAELCKIAQEKNPTAWEVIENKSMVECGLQIIVKCVIIYS